MSAARAKDDVRIEILCAKLKEADLSVEERDGLADDLRRAEQCEDPGTKDILISNVRRAMSEPVRIRRELEIAMVEHRASCPRADGLAKSIDELNHRLDSERREAGSSLEFTMPEMFGGKKVQASGGAVYLLIFVVSVLIFLKVNNERRTAEIETIRAEITHTLSPAHPAPERK